MWYFPDDHTQPVITARQQIQSDHGGLSFTLPDTALVFYMGRGMEVAAAYPSHIITESFPRFLKPCPIGRFDTGSGACFINGGSGAPQAADTLETLAACGVRRVIALGMCGVFRNDLAVGDVLLPPWALIEEGTSLHYDENPRRGEPDAELLSLAAQAFTDARQLPVVSSDAVYRQTYYKERLWRDEGCCGIDMETSALFTVSRVLGIKAVSILIASDRHPEEPGQDAWSWELRRDAREAFIRRGIEFVLSL